MSYGALSTCCAVLLSSEISTVLLRRSEYRVQLLSTNITVMPLSCPDPTRFLSTNEKRALNASASRDGVTPRITPFPLQCPRYPVPGPDD
eukprot:2534215-Rhodomonas_salina.1